MWNYVGSYLVYHINKVLGIVTRKLFNHLDLIVILEHFRDQRDLIVCGKSMISQLFPDSTFTMREKAVKLVNT